MERKEELLNNLRQLRESGIMETEPYKKARVASDKLLDELEKASVINYDVLHRIIDI